MRVWRVAAPLPPLGQGGGELPLLHGQEDHAPLPPQQHLPPGHPLQGGHHSVCGERHPALLGGHQGGSLLPALMHPGEGQRGLPPAAPEVELPCSFPASSKHLAPFLPPPDSFPATSKHLQHSLELLLHSVMAEEAPFQGLVTPRIAQS